MDTTINYLTPEDLARWELFEGYSNHLYLDGKGFVSIGYGCVIPDCQAMRVLRFYFKEGGAEASLLSKLDEYHFVEHSEANKDLSYYAKITKLYSKADDLFKLFNNRLNNTINNLNSRLYDTLDEYPMEVQQVLIEMGYNLGVTGLSIKFHKFMEAIQNKNYKAAAAESHRNGVQEARNKWVFDTLNNIKE